MRLTTQTIKGLKPIQRRQEVKDDGCPGLYLLVQPSGAKGWAVRYTIGNRVLKKTLGGFPDFSLADARAEAAIIRELVRSGRDPRDVERTARAEAERQRADTFGRLVERFLADCRELRSHKEVEATLRPIVAEWQDRPLASIHRRDVIDIIDRVKLTRGDYAAGKTLAWVRRAFNYAIGKALIETSPVTRVEPPVRAKARERVLSDSELRRLWVAAEARPYPFGPYLQLLTLTGARRTEVATLRWADIDCAACWIVIPADRFKADRPHLIPLSRQSLAVIDRLPQFGGPFVFSTRGGQKPISGFSKAKRAFDALLDPPFDYDLHDLRRTCRTGLARLRVPESTAERCLGHTLRGIERHYNMHSYRDEKAQALQMWADHVSRIVEGDAATNNVVMMVR